MKKLINAVLTGLFILSLTAVWVSADIRPTIDDDEPDFKALFEKYWDLRQNKNAAQGKTAPAQESCPGWIVGHWTERPDDLFCEPWPFRKTTYELFFPDKKSIGRVIYGMALFTKDLDPSVSLERFERGAGGFHYGVGQIVQWVNAVAQKHQNIYTREERTFLQKLVADRVILDEGGRYRSTGRYKHVLGAAPQKKRSLALNLDHERIHVMWDEDPGFKERYIRKWGGLSPEEKRAVYKRLKGYNPENEMQIIEEWAVRQNDKKPFWKSGR